MALKANIVIDQGTDFQALIDIEDPNGLPFDLTFYESAAQMRKSYASQTAYDFICYHNSGGGQITLQMPKSITKDLEPGRYLYDIEITTISNDVTTRVVEGIVTVTPGITRSM